MSLPRYSLDILGKNSLRPKLKYGNTHVKSHDGYSFDSKLEAALYDHLKALEAVGKIRDIRVKPNVYLTRARVLMIPDFMAYDIEVGLDSYYEAKGMETDVWRIKKRLWRFYGPGILHIYRGHYKRLTGPETIVPDLDPRDTDIDSILP